MKRFVLDASVALGWILGQEMAALAVRVRAHLENGEAVALVPLLWHWEVANAVVYHERRKLISGAGAHAAWESLLLWSTAVETDPHPPVPVQAAFLLARRYGLTVYDAAYLELALRQRLGLATLDGKLRGAACAAGVAVEF